MRKTRFLGLVAGLCALATLTQCFTQKKNEGQRLYAQHCANCHMDDGSGLRNLIPPLAGADYLVEQRHKLACIIRHGQEGEITVNGITYSRPMPANEQLNAGQITNILNYIQTNFGNKNERFTLQEVEASLFECRHLLE